jgi:hypothetical protein
MQSITASICLTSGSFPRRRPKAGQAMEIRKTPWSGFLRNVCTKVNQILFFCNVNAFHKLVFLSLVHGIWLSVILPKTSRSFLFLWLLSVAVKQTHTEIALCSYF